MARTIKSIDGVNINDDIRAVEQAMDLLEPRIALAHPALRDAMDEAYRTLNRAYQILSDRLVEAMIQQGR